MKTPSDYHLAQINIARLKAPLDDPIIDEFRESIDFVNETGSRHKGFVWIYRAPDGEASSYEVDIFPDPLIVVNFTVWERYEDLHDYVYNTVHSYFLKSRKRWFNKMERPHVALWWIPAGHQPTMAEAKAKLEQLERDGPGPEVFNLRQRFDFQGQAVV